jgi:hypothetical protein
MTSGKFDSSLPHADISRHPGRGAQVRRAGIQWVAAPYLW